MLLAATERGICRVEFGDDPKELEAGLRTRFGNSKFREGDAEFVNWTKRMLELIADPAAAFDVPLDVRGTEFQRRVWSALRTIPAGATWTYSQLAAHIHQASAVRAVAQACGANPIAVIVPCHRVIGAGGELRGYRWGVDRKRLLLEREAAHAAACGTGL